MNDLQGLAKSIAAQAKTERTPPSRIVCRAFVARLDHTTIQDAARVGLVSLANGLLHKGRHGGGGVDLRIELEEPGVAPVAQPGRPHPKDWRRIFDRIVLATVDGKSLLPIDEMPVDELEAVARQYQSKAEASERCRVGLDKVVATLRRKQVDTIAGLAGREQKKLAAVLATAWGE